MRVVPCVVFIVAAVACGVGSREAFSDDPKTPADRPTAWPKDWAALVGKTVTLEGTLARAKKGPMLYGKEDSIWIDEKSVRPKKGFPASMEMNGTRLRVVGTVVKVRDLPAFVPKKGEPLRGGMPVHSEADLEKAKWRYILKEAKWTVID